VFQSCASRGVRVYVRASLLQLLLLVLLLQPRILFVLLSHALHELNVIHPLIVRSTFGSNRNEPQQNVVAQQVASVCIAAAAIVVAPDHLRAATHMLDVGAAANQQVGVEHHHVRHRGRVAEQQERVHNQQNQIDKVQCQTEVGFGKRRAAIGPVLDGREYELGPTCKYPAQPKQ
jgi:hypothetical protein